MNLIVKCYQVFICIILFQLAFILSNETFLMVLFLVNYNNPGFESNETLWALMHKHNL